jgi:hypothetical protein
MKKPKKLKKPSLPKRLPRSIKRTNKAREERVTEAISKVPQITNETVAEHREEVLSSARKYIYPLQHSKRHVVRITVLILVAVIAAFFIFCGLSLYRFQSTSGFMYDVTRVIPFPIAKSGDKWVSYESYLFELRRNMHYYETKQLTDFSSESGKTQLTRLKQQAMGQVIQDAYVKQLAAQNKVTVSSTAINNQVALVRSENRLGSNERVFKEVLKEFWGWNETDFKRELSQEMLQQAVVAKLDTATNNRAAAAYKQVQDGVDFATVASQTSEDPATKANGGQYANLITPNDRNVAPAVTQALSKMKTGQTSGIINTGYTLEILKVLDENASGKRVAHIQFNFQPITVYTQPLQKKDPSQQYIKTSTDK